MLSDTTDNFVRIHSRTRPVHKNCRECGTNQRKLGANPRVVDFGLKSIEPEVKKSVIRMPSRRNRVKVRKNNLSNYKEYLNSDTWKDKRSKMMYLRGRGCEACGSKVLPLHVHHVIYERVGKERVTDLRILCFICHGDLHKRFKRLDRFNRSYKNLWRFTDEYIAKRQNKPENEPDNLLRSGSLLAPTYKALKKERTKLRTVFKDKLSVNEKQMKHYSSCLCKGCTRLRFLVRTKKIHLNQKRK